jgi:hypothetical protein
MNINAVIAHLVEMTPPQRKQFAQMHMDDPMMLSAAKFVDNQITKQAAAMSAQRMGAAPPPVNQQVVAQMSPQPPVPQAAPMPQAAPQQQAAPQPQGQAQPMPEDTGIAQLPAPNMEGMAGGGIVGFNQGGDLAKARQREEDRKNLLTVPAFLEDAVLATPKHLANAGVYLANQAKGAYGRVASALQNEDVPVGKDASYYKIFENTDKVRGNVPQEARVDDRPRRDATVYAPEKVVSPAARKDDRPNLSSLKSPPDKKKVGIEQLRADSVESAPPSKPTVTDRNYGTMYSDILKAQGDPRASIPKEIQEAQDLTKAQSDLELASANKRGKGLEALLATRNERLADREGRLKDQEELNPNMSLITAGLAMMQSTGKGLAGIGEGATKGMAQYMEGVKFNSAQRQKLEDARDALDELKFNQENMTEKDINAAKRIAMDGAIASKNAVLTHIQHTEGVNRKTADTLFTAKTNALLTEDDQRFRAGENALERQNRTAIANASAAVQERIAKMPGAQERLFATLGGGDAKKGFAFYTEQTAEGKGDEALLAALVKEPMLLSNLPKDLQDVVTNTLRARLVPPTVKAPPASQVRAP